MSSSIRKFRIALIYLFFISVVGLSAIVVRNRVYDAATLAVAEEDYPAALKRLRFLAAFGDSSAQYFLGELYAFGLGVPKDEATAITLFRRAAMWASESQDPAAAAMYDVGERYLGGLGIERDTEAAKRWFEKSAEGGYLKASEALVHLNKLESGIQNRP